VDIEVKETKEVKKGSGYRRRKIRRRRTRRMKKKIKNYLQLI
jgi:hypothetical protein